MPDSAGAGDIESDTDALLRRARTTILNLRAVCQKTARYNRATAENMNETLDIINLALGIPMSNREFRP